MKRRILSVILAMFLCISSHSVAQAQQKEVSVSGPVTRDSTVPTPTEVYEAMTALQDREEYKEGTIWTNDEPYSDSKGYYHWKGGTLGGYRISAVGCVAFAFILSDEAFGSLPARMYAAGSFTFDDIKVGDILRVNNDAHTVIVLEVSDAGVLVAEGNISTGDHIGKVHWGRAISKEEVMKNASHYITRYPKGYVSPDDPTANTIIGTGTLDGGLTWNLTKAGTMTISGSGAMPDFSSTAEQPWNNKSSQIRKVIIGNGITNIGSCAFQNCGVLSAEISPSVKTIGNSAFRESSLISVNIPSGVKTIGDSAFQQCQNLSSVSFSEGLETINQSAFSACTSLTSISLPASITEVGSAAFFQCQAMTSAKFAPGSKQVKLGNNIFMQCYYLMNVTLPQSIDRIGDSMFQNCLMLPGVEIPQGAESIGMSAFASCSGLTVVIIPDSVTTIGIASFSACPLREIYFTGTETQWNLIRKIGDTAAAVSKATIHYNYVPAPPPAPDTGGDNDPDSGNGETPDNGNNSGSGETPGNGSNSGSGETPGNGNNSGNGETPGNGADTSKDAGQNSAASITCKKTVYKVAYGIKPFKINASSKNKMTFTSSRPKIASVNKSTGKVTVKNTGIATITIRAGKASKKVTVKVSPKKQSVKTVTPGKGKKLTVKWTKDKRASGYKIQISTDKKFKKNVKSKTLKKTSYTFTKLKTGRKYYVRVRSYKKSGKDTLNGAWSKVKLSRKVKK